MTQFNPAHLNLPTEWALNTACADAKQVVTVGRSAVARPPVALFSGAVPDRLCDCANQGIGLGLLTILAAVSMGLFAPSCAVAGDLNLSVPVRLIGSQPAAEPPAMQPLRAAQPPQTLVRGLLPQYQATQAFQPNLNLAPEHKNPTMRFLLALPDQLLLLDATITVDGQPYFTVRERRIDSLLAQLSKPEEPAGTIEQDAVEGAAADNATSATPTPPAATPTPPAATPTPPANSARDGQADDAATDVPKTQAEKGAPPAQESPSEPDVTDAAGAEVKPTEDAKPADEAEAGEEADAKPEVPLIAVPSDALEARLRRYATVTGRPLTRDEVRWLLTKWVDGPTLLVLDENFQRFRGTQAPAFHALDRDMDGKLSANEIRDARQTLLSCDVNQNDVVEYTEIEEVADDPRRPVLANPVQALIPILDASSVAKAFRRLVKATASSAGLERIDLDADGQLNDSELAALAKAEPDVTLVIAFDSKDVGNSTTRITQLADDLATQPARTMGNAMTIPVGRTCVEFSAVQAINLGSSDQVSAGIVNDGYPLLPAIDPNEDGRLTIREMRKVGDLLRGFDVNKDGAISSNEVPATVRVAFGLGPCVHQHLADLRTVYPPASVSASPAPEWFTRMDRNKDGDISPREFLLGPEQFKKLDKDSDGLISPAEAAESAQEESTGATPEITEPTTEEAKATP